MTFTPFLLAGEAVTSVEGYLAADGGLGLAAALDIGPAATVEELSRSGVRGRGGGGFPTGRKWSTIRESTGTHRYVVCNAAEGEPATFKDRALIRHNPYQLVEGVVIAALTVGAAEAFVALKASFEREVAAVTRAVEEMQAAGLGGDVPVTVVTGPEEYLFGEEKALLEVIEGNAPMPRLLAPFEHGLFATAPQLGWQAHDAQPGRPSSQPSQSNPTLVNNAETLSIVPHVLARGATWYRSMGSDGSPGSVVATLVGDVVRPAVAEVEMGTPLAEVIDQVGGGMAQGRRVKAVFSGIANPVLSAEQLGTRLTYEDMAAAGSGLGAAGFAVYDDTTCMPEVARAYSQFLYVESCAQCPPCKFGSGEITAYLERVERGVGDTLDVERIGARLRTVTDGNRCYLPVQEQRVVSSILRAFPGEFADHLEGRGCARAGPVLVPKIVDLHDGRVVYDERQARKQPDWTYDGEAVSGG